MEIFKKRNNFAEKNFQLKSKSHYVNCMPGNTPQIPFIIWLQFIEVKRFLRFGWKGSFAAPAAGRVSRLRAGNYPLRRGRRTGDPSSVSFADTFPPGGRLGVSRPQARTPHPPPAGAPSPQGEGFGACHSTPRTPRGEGYFAPL